MLVAMTSEFVGLIWPTYSLLVAVIDNGMSGPKIKIATMFTAWLLFRCFKVVYVVTMCHMAKAEARQTGVVVQQILLLEEIQQKQGTR